MLGPPETRRSEETCLSQGPPPEDAALRRALALSAREIDDGGLQRALALSAAEARTEVVDLTLSQGSEDRGLSRTADDSQMEATQLEETQLVAPRRSVVDVSASPPDPAAPAPGGDGVRRRSWRRGGPSST